MVIGISRRVFKFMNSNIVFLHQVVKADTANSKFTRGAAYDSIVSGQGLFDEIEFYGPLCEFQIYSWNLIGRDP
jgi:hypothetical protein